MRRRDLIRAMGGAALAFPIAARAQQGKAYRIGVLVLSDEDGRIFVRQLSAGLRDLGWSEGRNFSIELRSAESKPDRLPGLAAELVQLKPDVIAAAFTPCATAAKQATQEIPIVMAAAGDPIGTGLVTSLAKPGGNITGLSNMGAETAGKLVELFRDMLPSLTRVAILAHKDDAFTRSLREQVLPPRAIWALQSYPRGSSPRPPSSKPRSAAWRRSARMPLWSPAYFLPSLRPTSPSGTGFRRRQCSAHSLMPAD